VITLTGAAEATRTRDIGSATAAAEEALGLARAKGFEAQTRAIGSEQTAFVAALREVGAGHVKIVPDIQVGGDSGVIGGLGAMLMRTLATNNSIGHENGGGENGNSGNGSNDTVVIEDSASPPAVEAPVESANDTPIA
jgi:uncharacterized membrane protein YqiK